MDGARCDRSDDEPVQMGASFQSHNDSGDDGAADDVGGDDGFGDGNFDGGGGGEEVSVLSKINRLLSSMGLDGFANFSNLKQMASPMFVGIIENLLMTQFEGVVRRPTTQDEHVGNLRIAIEHLSGFLKGDLFNLIDPQAVNSGNLQQISSLVDILYELHYMVVQAPPIDAAEAIAASTAAASAADAGAGGHAGGGGGSGGAARTGEHGVGSESPSDRVAGATIDRVEQKQQQLAQRHDQRRQKRRQQEQEQRRGRQQQRRQQQQQQQQQQQRSPGGVGLGDDGEDEENDFYYEGNNGNDEEPGLPAAQVELMGVVVEELQQRDPALLRSILADAKESHRLRRFNQARPPPDPYLDEAGGQGVDLEYEEEGGGSGGGGGGATSRRSSSAAAAAALEEREPNNVIFSTTMELRRQVHDRSARGRRQHRLAMEAEKHRRRNLQHVERVMAIKQQNFSDDIRDLQRRQRITRESLEAERTKALFKTLVAQKRNDLVYQRKQQQLILQQTRQEVANVQERLRNFYTSQADLLREQMREEDDNFQLRLQHEREIRRQAIRQVKHTQEKQFEQLRVQMEQSSSAVVLAPAADTVREDVYDLIHSKGNHLHVPQRSRRVTKRQLRRRRKENQLRLAARLSKAYGNVL